MCTFVENMAKVMDELKCTELLDQHHIKPTANRILVVKSLAVANRPMSLSELENKILEVSPVKNIKRSDSLTGATE